MKKFKKVIWPVIYFLLIVAVCFSGTLLFHNYYYSNIFVDGPSMQPTLNNNCIEFGIVDESKWAIDRIDRFDIIVTYYHWESKDYKQPYVKNSELNGSDPAYKIKRVYGLPNDRFKLIEGQFFLFNNETLDWDNIALPFTPKTTNDDYSIKNVPDITLGADEYFVIGDNWSSQGSSVDSVYLNHGPIYKENIQGVLVAIEGRCELYNYKCRNCDHKYVNFVQKCSSCGGNIMAYKDIKSKHYYSQFKYF